MTNFWRKGMTRSIVLALCLVGALCLTGMFAVAQTATPQDSCVVVHVAYKKTFQTQSQMSTKNSGAVDVTKARGKLRPMAPIANRASTCAMKL
jgi:hypothetical protein